MAPAEDCGIAVRGLGADFFTLRSLPGPGSDGGPLPRPLRDVAAEDRELALGSRGAKSRSALNDVRCVRNSKKQTNRIKKAAMAKPTKRRGRLLPGNSSSNVRKLGAASSRAPTAGGSMHS